MTVVAFSVSDGSEDHLHHTAETLEDASEGTDVDYGDILDTGCVDAMIPSDASLDPLPILTNIAFDLVPAGTPRLTQVRIQNALMDVFGAGTVVPAITEPDLKIGGFATVGARISSLSPRGIEIIERFDYPMAQQGVFESDRQILFDCDVQDDMCVQHTIADWGRRLWRRTLDENEIGRLMALYREASRGIGQPGAGFECVISALIQSPHFLYVRQSGENGQHRGMFDGAIESENILFITENIDGGEPLPPFVRTIGRTLADMRPNSDGHCQALPVSINFETEGANFFEDSPRIEDTDEANE